MAIASNPSLTERACRRSAPPWAVAAVCLAFWWPIEALADPPPGYYDSVDAGSAVALRATLHEVIDDHTRYPYTSGFTDTWDILEQADEDPNNSSNILDVYRNTSYAKIGGGTGPYDREHTWPKSYGFPDDNSQNYPYTDCHQLHPCDGGYNSSRGNKPYRYCNPGCAEQPTAFNNGQGGGSGTYPGNSNWTWGQGSAGTWETWMGRRGEVARALMYLDVRYEGGTHGITGAAEPDLILTDNESLIAASSTGSNESVAYMGLLSDLLLWHLEDPVDDLEWARNEVVFNYQGNRNPFVDHPEWADCLFQGDCPSTCGDIDGSGGPVDLNDFASFAVCFGLSGPAPGCSQEAFDGSDMDAGGTVDLNDFATFAVWFGLQSTGRTPASRAREEARCANRDCAAGAQFRRVSRVHPVSLSELPDHFRIGYSLKATDTALIMSANERIMSILADNVISPDGAYRWSNSARKLP